MMTVVPTAYTDRNVLGAAERAALLATLKEKGIRLLPYPFDSAVAVVSDIDAACQPAIDGYVGMLVRRLGLDFGDSIWLTSNDVDDGDWALPGQGFLNADFSASAAFHDEATVRLQTFAQAVAQYHAGNVDHFHAFLQAGPRVLLLRPEVRDGAVVTARLSQTERTAMEHLGWLCAFGVSAIGVFHDDHQVSAVRVIADDGRSDDGFVVTDRYAVGERWQIDAVKQTPVAARPDAIALSDIAEVQVTFTSEEAASALDHLLVVTAPRALLLDRIAWLAKQHAISMSLITEHAGVHFRSRRRTEVFDRALVDAIRDTGSVGPHNGRYVVDDAVVFSTDADDPESVSRVLPELATDHDLRFIVPHAATSDSGWPVVDLVTPTPTRAGCGLYWARRTLPNIRTPEGRKKFDGTRSRQSTFTQRMRRVLDGSAATPGSCWPIYTHLGRLDDDAPGMPDPYFEEAELLTLQDRVFGFTRAGARGPRIWFTRASTLYDYALAIRSIADHVVRPDANTVAISSWTDVVLDQRMPRCAAQLYGLTFAVDDPAEATVTLDGRAIETLYRNPPRANEGASVTIAEAGLRWPVVGAIDPVDAIRDTTIAGGWTWDAVTRSGRLIGGAGRLGSLRMPLGGRQPEGAQALALDIHRERGSAFGITVETVTGARFFFGDRPVALALGDAFAARAFIPPSMRRNDVRQRWAFAFHDLVWAADARPGGPLPNHALAAVTLWTLSRGDGGATFGDVAFLRPHTRATGDDFCLAGSAAGAPGSAVEATRVGDAAVIATTLVDPHRHFCFGVLPAGAYHVRNVDGRAAWVDPVRAIVDLSAHAVDLRLIAAA